VIKHPEAINHRADAYVFDLSTGTGHLIDYTFVNSMKSTGKNGAAPGGQADVAEVEKYKEYGQMFDGLSADSSPALVILAMERHGSFSKGTLAYWKAAVHAAHERQKTSESPSTYLSRRVHWSTGLGRWLLLSLPWALASDNSSPASAISVGGGRCVRLSPQLAPRSLACAMASLITRA